MSHFYEAGGWTNFRLKIKDGPHIVPVLRHSPHGLLLPLCRLSISSHAPAGAAAAPTGAGVSLGGRGQMAQGALVGDKEKGASNRPASLAPKLLDLGHPLA